MYPKIILTLLLTFFVSNFSFTQKANLDKSYILLLKRIYSIGKLAEINTTIRVDENGQNFIYIYNPKVDGLPNEERYLSLKLSTLFAEMIYDDINYLLKKEYKEYSVNNITLSFTTFTEYIFNSGFAGIKFESKNYIYIFDWLTIKDQHKKNN